MTPDISKLSDEVSRRTLMQSIAAMTLGLGASMPAQASDSASTNGKKKVVRIFLGGGMSHLDSFDPKRQSPQIMGNTKVIKGKTGEDFSEHFPMMAKRLDKLAIVRSMSSSEGDHGRGRYLFETSYPKLGTIRHPNLGAWMQRLNGVQNKDLPASVNIQSKFDAGFLGSSYDPFIVNKPSQALKGLVMNDPTSKESLQLLKMMAEVRMDFHKAYPVYGVDDYRKYYNDSIKLMQSSDLDAFDLGKEDKQGQKKYNIHHGDSFLLARRLLEANVQYVTMNIGNWDDHMNLWDSDNFPTKAKNLDRAFSTFLDDLEERGLLKDTVIAMNTEFGRTPKITEKKGRDHHRKAFSCLLAGSGVNKGLIYGKTDDQGASVIENPVTPTEFNATLAKLAGLDLNKEIYSPDNRPFTVARGGKVIESLIS